MNRRTFVYLTLGIFFTLPLIQACEGGVVSSETTSSPGGINLYSKISVTPSGGEVAAGKTFDRTVNIEAADPTFFTAFDMTYDPTIIEFVGAGEGTFLNRNGADRTSFGAALQNGNPGRVTVGITRLGPIGDVSGNGNLAILTFRAINPGTTVLAFSSPRGLKGSENRNNQIDNWGNGIVTVR